MKLLQINVVANSGSTGRITEQIGQLAINQGWESYIAFGRYSMHSTSQLIKIGTKLEILWHVFITRLFDRHGLGSKKATRKLINEIERIQPTIIHLHNIHGYYLNYEILFNYLIKVNIPVVWTLHDCWAFTGHCTHFSFIKCDRWKNGCFNCSLKKAYPTSILLDRSKKNYVQKKERFTQLPNLTIVTVSDWLANMAKASFLSVFPIERIYNGVDTDAFCKKDTKINIKTKYALPDKKILLGIATVWSERKGFSDYLELAKIISDEFILVLVGLNDKQIAQLPSNIIGLKRTENMDDLTGLYCEASVVLNLSYEETFGLTSVEGMSCGTPTVVYNATASPELVTRETGIIVEPGNISAVWKGIQELANRDKTSLEKACRKRAIEYFDKNKRFEDYFQLYEELITKKDK